LRGDLTGALRPALEWAEHRGELRLRITGLAAETRDRDLAVLPGEAASATHGAMQPMAGGFVRSAEGVDFVPRFPFLEGRAYSLVIAPCTAFPAGCVLTLRREARAVAPSPAVAAVHPDVEVAPLNLLKLYVRFSEPMAEGAARRGVRVEDTRTGEPLDGVFLDMDPELWDPERRRLTLLLDPGRIKRGLVPHEEAGYPLSEGAVIRLTIGAPFRSASDAPLAAVFSRTYAVGAALRRPISTDDWRLDAPDEGSIAPLRLEFDRPLDHAMLEHAFQVLDAEGAAVAGVGATLPGEMGWAFHPAAAWRGGPHRLIVDARLEDLAGNSLRRVFDRDLACEGDLGVQTDEVTLSFHCPPAVNRVGPDRIQGAFHQ
jgi:hypothetical protein